MNIGINCKGCINLDDKKMILKNGILLHWCEHYKRYVYSDVNRLCMQRKEKE